MAGGRRPGSREVAIVIGASNWIGEDRPRLVDVAHSFRRLNGALVEIGMMALRQAPMRTGHLERGRVASDAEDRVWIEGATAGHGADSTAARRSPSV